MARLKYGLRSKLCTETEDTAEWSKRSRFSPAQPRRAETRLSAGKAAASEDVKRYIPHFV
jgi:hypothetical protein